MSEYEGYEGCQNVTAAWGSICPDCGQRLPQWSRKEYEAQRGRDKEARIYLYRDPNITFGTVTLPDS